MGLTPLQTCARYAPEQNYTDALANGSFMDAVTCPFANQVGSVAFPVIVFGTVGLGLYIYTRSVLIPLVLAIILGPIVMHQLSAPPIAIMTVTLMLVLTTAAYLVWRKIGQ